MGATGAVLSATTIETALRAAQVQYSRVWQRQMHDGATAVLVDVVGLTWASREHKLKAIREALTPLWDVHLWHTTYYGHSYRWRPWRTYAIVRDDSDDPEAQAMHEFAARLRGLPQQNE